MKEFKVGVIGWGFMGKTHAHAVMSLPLFYPGSLFRARLSAVASRRPASAEEAVQSAGFEKAYDSWQDLIQDPEIDVVSVCTPNALHREMACEALRAGKHLYIDKPLAVTSQEADEILRAAEESGAHAHVAFNNRYFPATLRMKEMADSGMLGEILTFSARYLHSGSIDEAKPMGWKQGEEGGVVLDLASHALDLLTHMIGYPASVFCRTRTLYPARPKKDGTVETKISEDHASMILTYENGAVGTVEASKIATGAEDELVLEIRGKRAAVRWSSREAGILEYFDNERAETALGGLRGFTRIECGARYSAPGGAFLPPKMAIGWVRGHVHSYYAFLSALSEGRDSDSTVREAARLQHLMDACLLSAREGREVTFQG